MNGLRFSDAGRSQVVTDDDGMKPPNGARPSLYTTLHPRVPTSTANCMDPATPNYPSECQPDYSQYQPIRLEAEEPLLLSTIVTVPELPPVGSECAEAATVFAAVSLGQRGIIPLGFGAANDVVESEPPDCIIAGAETPFGDASAPLADGEVALSTAPRHAGLEGHPLALIAVARSSILGASALFSRSVRIDRVSSFAPAMIVGPWLAPPSGSVDAASASVRFDATGGTFVRVELYGPGTAWLIYAPGSRNIFVLPQVTARSVLTALRTMILLRADSSVDYDELFGLGGRRIDRGFEFVERFAIQEVQP